VIYGSLPLVHDTGGLHDTVEHINLKAGTGNGFVFRRYSNEGLAWAIDEAMRFWQEPAEVRAREVTRIMLDGKARFNHNVCAQHYIDIYEKMLRRKLVKPF
jgi:glycogen synthase